MNVHGKAAPLVGRVRELSVIRDALAAGLRRTGGAVVLAGEPGIGKTRLLEAAVDAAVGDDYLVASTANFEHARAPFGPFADSLRMLLAACEFAVPAADSDRRTILRLIGDASSDDGGSGFDKRRAFVIVGELLGRIAARRPWMIGIDDAQWCDPESLELLQYLIPKIAAMRGVIVLASRPGSDADATVAWLGALERFPNVRLVMVPPMDDQTSRALIAATSRAGKRLSQREVTEICARADGNPLLMGVLAREALAADGAHASSTIEHAVVSKLRLLTAAELRVIEAAAVLGRVFTLDHVAAISGLADDAVVAALRAARDAGVVDEGREADGSFRFRHELIREAVYANLLTAEKRNLHRRAAEFFTEHTSGTTDLLAGHWLRAGERTRAAELAERAGDEALELNALASARDRFLEALEGKDAASDRARIELKLGRAYDRLGDATEAAARLSSAMAFHRDAGNRAEAARIALSFANIAQRAGRADEALAACATVADDTTLDAELRFGAHAVAALTHAVRDEIEPAARHILLAERLDAEGILNDRLSLEWARMLVARAAGDHSCLVNAQRAVALAAESPDPSVSAHTLLNFSMIAREYARDSDSDAAIAKAIELSDRGGHVLASGYARCEKAEVDYGAGRIDEAYSLLIHVTALHVDTLALRMWLAELALPVLADLGKLDQLHIFDIEGTTQAALQGREAVHVARLAAGRAYVSQTLEEPPHADAISIALDALRSPLEVESALAILAHSSSAADRGRIAALLREAPAPPGFRKYRTLTEATLALRNGDGAAGSLLAHAYDAAGRASAPLLQARALELMGRRSEAAALYQQCGAVAQVRRLNGARKVDLTPREREVAELVIAGLSNRAIAQRLVLSERTIENHVASVFTKSGVRKRSDFIAQALT